MGSQSIIMNSGVKWVTVGWTAFIAENLILSENRDVSHRCLLTIECEVIKLPLVVLLPLLCILQHSGFDALDSYLLPPTLFSFSID